MRCNAITPGLIDTPMAIEGHSKASGIDKDALRKGRDRAVPMGHVGPCEPRHLPRPIESKLPSGIYGDGESLKMSKDICGLARALAAVGVASHAI